MHKKVKESIDSIIGPHPILSESKKRKILRQLHHRSHISNNRLMKKSLPVVAALVLFFAGVLFALLLNNNGQNLALHTDKNTKQSYENQETGMMESADTDGDNIVQGKLNNQNTDEYLSDVEMLKIENEKLEHRISILEAKLADDQQQQKILYGQTDSHLKDAGFNGSTDGVIAEVVKQNDLIPNHPGLSEKVHFVKDRIFLISHKNVYAEFTDGKRNGYLILQFNIADGQINDWKVIEYFVED